MMTRIHEISKAFNHSATGYEAIANVQKEIGMRLFDRLHYLKINPKRILDLGCGPGVFSYELKKRYPKAQVFGVDLAHSMLIQAKKKQGFLKRWPLVAADMHDLPFEAGFFDLVFANQVIHWGETLNRVFRELSRVMSAQGCLMFTTLGPDTFKELTSAWRGVDMHAHANEFKDMHDVGDSLMAEHFLDPVVDMESLSIHYKTLPELVRALKAQGVKNINPKRNHGLTGKHAWQQFEKNYATLQVNERYPLSYEVVYGHAWKGAQRKTQQGVETLIPLSSIKKR